MAVAAARASVPNRLSQPQEVRCRIAGAAVAAGVGEGFHRQHRMPVHRLVVSRDPAQGTPQNLAREVVPSPLREYTEPLVVDHPPQPPGMSLHRPPEVPVPRSAFESGGPEAEQCNPDPILGRDVPHRLAHQPMSQPVVSVQLLVEAANLPSFDGLDHQPIVPAGSQPYLSFRLHP